MKIGLYFGTFNPVHIGHLIIANHLVEHSDLDEIWMVITPQNPFKQKKSMLDNIQRFTFVDYATEDFPKIKASKIEFNLPQPNYTVHTLAHISDEFPDKEFCLIMGEDNLQNFHKWKNYETILEHHEIYVYPRISEGKTVLRFEKHPKIHKINAPIVQISSTMIRNGIKAKKNVQPLLPSSVWKYIDEMNFYKK